MSEPQPTVQVAASPAPKELRGRRRFRRWILRIFKWGWVGLFCAIFLVLSGYYFRLKLANYLLARSVPGIPCSVSAVEWEKGALVLRGVTIGSVKQGKLPLLAVARVEAPWSQKKTVGRIVIEKPVLHLDAEGLAILDTLKGTPDPQNLPATPSASTPFSLEGLEIVDADLHYISADGHRLQANLKWQGEEIAQLADGSLAIGRQRVELSPRGQTFGPDSGQVPPLVAEWSVDPKTHRVQVHTIKTTRPGRLMLEPELLALMSPSAASPASAPTDPAGSIQAVEIENASVEKLQVMLPKCPGLDKALSATLSLTARYQAGGKTTAQWRLQDVLLDNQFPLPSVSGNLYQGDFVGATWDVRDVQIEPQPVSNLLEAAQTLGWNPPVKLQIHGQASAKVPHLLVTPAGVSFSTEPSVELSDISLQGAQATEPFAQWKRLFLQADPMTVAKTGILSQLVWEAPDVKWSNAVLESLSPSKKTPAAPPTASQLTAVAAADAAPLPAVWKVTDLQIKGGKLLLSDWGEGFPRILSEVEAHTAPLLKGGENFYHLTLKNPQVNLADALPGVPPLYQGREVFAAIHPERIWTRSSLEQVRFFESRIDVGAIAADADLLTLPSTESSTIIYEAPARTGQEPGEGEALDLPVGWHIRSLALQNTRVHLHRLIPDLSEIVLPISYKAFHNIPLEPEELAKHDEPMRLELPLVNLPGTRAGTSVADLDTNFIHFRLSGLMQQQIDRVQMVNPKIYVGDSLFHYIDKLRSESAGPDPAKASVAKVALALFAQLGGEMPSKAAEKEKGWSILKLQAVNGKLITTVKDSPLSGVPPLPFGADSSLKDSEINAELAIPPGLYKPILGMELVAALKGGFIKFNLPRKQGTNNLVQVFEADWLRFKQLRITDVKLSVTYDEYGIYAKFWASAYGGYIEGALNLYLTDNLSWDGWLSLTDVEATEITKIMTPTYFNMDGKITGSLVAQGDKAALYQATGSLRGVNKGKMKILALEEVIASLPKDWEEVQRKWVKKALETVRDFRYENFKGDLRFYGLEGAITLKLDGPDGQRNIEVHSHDRRLEVP